MSRFLSLFVILCLGGCASTNFSPRFERTGKYELSQVSAINKKASEMRWAESEDVKVFIGEGPSGIYIDENGALIYDDKEWALLGKVTASPNSGGGLVTYAFQEYPEDQDWRNTYCKINGVFLVATIGFWNFTPFPMPCQVREGNSAEEIDERKMRIVNTLKKVTKAAGGELVVISSLGNIEYQNSAGRTLSITDMMSADGFALKRVK